MSEWMEGGVLLAWLIDPQEERVHVYRANGSIEIVEGFSAVLSGENVLPDFAFPLELLKK
jgi:Uma2 family endonuclease